MEVPDEPAGGGGRRGAALAWIGWWLASAALWLALVDTTRSHELVAGAVAATLAATLALVVRSQRHVVLRPLPVWLLRLWRPLASYPADMWRLSVELVRTTLLRRPPRGQLFALSYDPGEDEPRAAARRVLGNVAGSFAPNTYVVGVDEERRLLLVHQLAPGDPAVDVDPLELR